MSLANNAAWLREAGSRLKARGFNVAYEPGWESRSNGGASPDHEAIIVHHTGATTTSTSYLRDGEKGRSMIPPYAQIHVRRDATLVIIAAGGASHAGYVHKPCWDRIIGQTAPLDRDLAPGPDGTFSPNRPGIGVEVNGAGGPDDWTPQQRAAVVAFCVEYHRVRGWTGVPKVGAHKELTTRKPGDPYEPMGRLRTDIKTALTTQEDPLMALTDSEQRRLVEAADRVMGAIPAGSAGGRVTAQGKPARVMDSEDGDYLRKLLESVGAKLGVDIASIRSTVDAQTATISQAVEALRQVAGTLAGDQAAQIEQIADRLQITVRPEGSQA